MLRSEIAKLYRQSSKEYTNLLLNGSLEADFASWNRPGAQPTICTNDGIDGGKCACWYEVSASYNGIGQGIIIPANHMVYAFFYYKITARTSGNFFAHVVDGEDVNLGYLQPPSTPTGEWARISKRFISENANLTINPSSSNFTGTGYIDAICIIDLTEKFCGGVTGTGNEPLRAWCDANITIDKIDWRLS